MGARLTLGEVDVEDGGHERLETGEVVGPLDEKSDHREDDAFVRNVVWREALCGAPLGVTGAAVGEYLRALGRLGCG